MQLNQAHLHLLLNHLPVVGSIAVFLLLLFGMFTRSRPVVTAGLVGLFLVALVAIPVFYSGEPAEEMVEDSPHVSHDYIEAHEEMATKTYYAALAAGVFALIALFAGRGRYEYPAWITMISLLLSLAAVGLTGVTASLGGKISHPEIREDGLLPFPGSWMPDVGGEAGEQNEGEEADELAEGDERVEGEGQAEGDEQEEGEASETEGSAGN